MEMDLATTLIEIGAKLKDPPKVQNDKLSLLESLEDLISGMGQEPSFPVLYSLRLAKEGLITDQWFGNSDIHVKVSSLVCLHELIRITALDAPFEDEKMKEIYEETVKSFKHLSLGTGRCFVKVSRILSCIAKDQSGLQLLDLGCESLVVQMFQLFLSDIRSDYPSDVVSKMESLMTTLIMGARELSLDILRPLLMSIRSENQGITSSPSRILARKVLENCSVRVKPRLIQMAEKLKDDLEASTNTISSLWPETHAEENVILPENGRAEEIEPLPSQLGTGEEVHKRKTVVPAKFLDFYVNYDRPQGSPPKRKKKEEKVSCGSENPKGPKITENSMENPEELLGVRIKVWWPEKQEYIEGVIQSYEPNRKMHKVAFADKPPQRLRLKERKWYVVPADEAIAQSNVRVQHSRKKNKKG